MPYRPKKPCRHPGCAKLTDGRYCEEHISLHPEVTRSAAKRGYGSKWRTASKAYLREHPLCEICKRNGFTVYGYNLKKRNLTINEEQASVVREIFDMYLDGKGSNVIARTLNERNIPAPRGEIWHQARIMQILRNEKYIGDDKVNIERIYGDSFLDITDLNQLPSKLTAVVKRHIRV